MNKKPTKNGQPPRRIHLLVAVSISVVALVFTLFSATYAYYYTYKTELHATKVTLSQLVATVEGTAAIATYLDNRELALDVTNGLMKNDIVSGAAVMSEQGMLVSSGFVTVNDNTETYSFPLSSPFSPEQSVGKIVVKPKVRLIEQQARSVALDSTKMLFAHSVLITLLVMLLVDRLLARPLTRLARELHHIKPGSGQTLAYPRWHTEDEIGGLVADTNHLLLSVHDTLNNERTLRGRIEAYEKHFRLIFEKAGAGIFLIDQQGILLSSNSAFDKLVGVERAQQIKDTMQARVTELFENAEEFRLVLEKLYHGSAEEVIDLELSGTDEQTVVWLHCLLSRVVDDEGSVIIEGLVNDITERTHREKRILFEAEHDSLTKLFNRRSGEIRLRQAISLSEKRGAAFALLLLDLDHFKPINDKYGHEAGDQVLVEVARRLRESVRQEDIVIRWGGDEFVLGLYNWHDFLDPSPMIKKLIKEVCREIILDSKQSVTVGTSIGIAIYPTHAKELDLLVARADQVMYEVKETGRNSYKIYNEEIH